MQWSILNHCDETGVTAMYLSSGMDEGDIIEIRKTPIEPMETTSELMARLSPYRGRSCLRHCARDRSRDCDENATGQREGDLRADALEGYEPD